MCFSFEHMKWLVKSNQQLKTSDGKSVDIFEFRHVKNEQILSAWAKHFRNHYCLDSQIDSLRCGTEYSRAEYLNKIKFPDKSIAPGPSIRAGDFAEILAADYLEYILKHWVPRVRYSHKTVSNESTKGSDTIGFMFSSDGNNSKDTLTIIESKAKYTGNHENRLQTAIDHSSKDIIRKAETLNAIKQRFLDKEDIYNSQRIERFQNEADNPYIQNFVAIAHLDNSNFTEDVITSANSSSHSHADQLFLIVIKGDEMMKLVHELYERAANEA